MKQKFRVPLALLFLLTFAGVVLEYSDLRSYMQSKERSKIYELLENTQLKDITDQIKDDQTMPLAIRSPFKSGERRLLIFKYRSDDQWVAGSINYLVQGQHPVAIFLRGGNGFFGIMRPNNPYTFLKNHHVIQTLYRGNVYGGDDDLGGGDVNDVENLLRFIPDIKKATGIELAEPYKMFGTSRGATQMVLSLARSDYVKSKVSKAISLSGALDLHEAIKSRFDLGLLYRFKALKSGSDLGVWLSERDPVTQAEHLQKNLKVLILQGLSDDRISMAQSDNFHKRLTELGVESKIKKFPEGDHGLLNRYDEVEQEIVNF